MSDWEDVKKWVLFEDRDLLVINKPAGLLSVEDGYEPALPHVRSLLEPEFGQLWMIHRLDKETSGVMVLARSADMHREMNRVFKEREISKIYHCDVKPAPGWSELSMDQPLKVNADRSHHTRVDFKRGKAALTIARVLEAKETGALLECEIFSGYRHQIRAHLYYQGLWILGDRFYVPKTLASEETGKYKRMMLHARKIAFKHPGTGNEVSFTAAYPENFSADINI